jgi:hypothetical protein
MNLADLPSHHAILLVNSERSACGLALWNELQSLSPAHRLFNQTVLDIDTARAITSWALSSYNDEKIALISFHTASIPAQNAMLKMLEEPRRGVRFILLTSNKENLIGTVLSRVHYVQGDASQNDSLSAVEFLKTAPTARMKLPIIVELLSRIDEEGRKDRERVRAFILSVANVLSSVKASPRYITETLQTASYVSDPSASGKALLEYLTLLLPVIKS